MNDRIRVGLRFAGVQLALIAAGLHLVWGVPRLAVYLRVGRMPDPRPALFVVSGAAVAVAVIALYYGGRPRLVYGSLVLVMLLYLFGYVGWHLGSHGGGLFPGLRPIHHAGDPVTILVDHLRSTPKGQFTLAHLLAETGAVLALLPLLLDRGD